MWKYHYKFSFFTIKIFVMTSENVNESFYSRLLKGREQSMIEDDPRSFEEQAGDYRKKPAPQSAWDPRSFLEQAGDYSKKSGPQSTMEDEPYFERAKRGVKGAYGRAAAGAAALYGQGSEAVGDYGRGISEAYYDTGPLSQSENVSALERARISYAPGKIDRAQMVAEKVGWKVPLASAAVLAILWIARKALQKDLIGALAQYKQERSERAQSMSTDDLEEDLDMLRDLASPDIGEEEEREILETARRRVTAEDSGDLPELSDRILVAVKIVNQQGKSVAVVPGLTARRATNVPPKLYNVWTIIKDTLGVDEDQLLPRLVPSSNGALSYTYINTPYDRADENLTGKLIAELRAGGYIPEGTAVRGPLSKVSWVKYDTVMDPNTQQLQPQLTVTVLWPTPVKKVSRRKRKVSRRKRKSKSRSKSRSRSRSRGRKRKSKSRSKSRSRSRGKKKRVTKRKRKSRSRSRSR
jgi:hypothetical protein